MSAEAELVAIRAETDARRRDLVRVREYLRSNMPMKRARVDRMQRLLQTRQADLQEDLNVLDEMETTE